MSCGPIVATEHKRQKITTDNNQIKITNWSKNEVKCVVLIMKIYDTYIFQNSGINWEIFPHQLVNDIRSLSCGPIVVCLIMKHILKIFSRIQVLIEEKIPINRRFAKCFLLDVLASLESMMSLIMSLIQNSRSLTKSYLPFFSKPRNTGNTSDKRNTPNYVIHVIHLIKVFTSSTSNASNTSDASYASNESNASKSSASVGRLSSYLK